MRNGIRLSGKRLGGHPKESEIIAANKSHPNPDLGRRHEVAGEVGSGQWMLETDLIMPWPSKAAETLIAIAFWLAAQRRSWSYSAAVVSLFRPGFMHGIGQITS